MSKTDLLPKFLSFSVDDDWLLLWNITTKRFSRVESGHQYMFFPLFHLCALLFKLLLTIWTLCIQLCTIWNDFYKRLQFLISQYFKKSENLLHSTSNDTHVCEEKFVCGNPDNSTDELVTRNIFLSPETVELHQS